MKANNIKCLDYFETEKGMTFILNETTPQEALEQDWSTIQIYTDNGHPVPSQLFVGYQPKSASIDAATNYVYLELVTGADKASLIAMQKLSEENAELREELDIQGNLLQAMIIAESKEEALWEI